MGPPETDGLGLRLLEMTVWVPPVPQVRQTGRSGAYMPPAVRYNGWKRRVSDSVKAALRKAHPDMAPFAADVQVRLTVRFHISDVHRVVNADLDNFVKAAKDMLNHCGREWDPVRWPDATAPFPVWKDDGQVWEYGVPTGKYWTPQEADSRIEFTLERIHVTMPVKYKPKTVAAHKKEIYAVAYDLLRGSELLLLVDDPRDEPRRAEALEFFLEEMRKKAGLGDRA